jgi:hypothetical protein
MGGRPMGNNLLARHLLVTSTLRFQYANFWVGASQSQIDRSVTDIYLESRSECERSEAEYR